MSAALGHSQMQRIDDILARRAAVAETYRGMLDGIPGIRLIGPVAGTTRMSWFAAIARLDPGYDRDAVIAALEALGIPARAYFAPIHLQPFYTREFGYGPGDFPVTERVARSTLALPFFTAMTEAQVAEVCDAVAQVLNRSARQRRAALG